MCPMRMAVFQELTKTENSSDSAFYAPPFLYPRQSNRLAFLFSPPKIYPQKPPCVVSGKLSSTPKPRKVAHLLRFFGKYLFHLRFLTQRVIYCKSTLVYYNIPSSFFQAVIHTSRDANWSHLEIFIFINWRILCAMAHLCLNACANMTHRQK